MMKSLWTKFFLSFVMLGVLIAVGVGLVMYIEYHRYIQDSYRKTLTNLADLIEQQYPVLVNPDYILGEAKINSDTYWQIPRDLRVLADSFNVTYIYLLVKNGPDYWFVFSTDDPDSITDANEAVEIYPQDEIPDELDLVFASGERQFSAPYTDEWGSLISLFVPVFSGGKVVAIIGLDYDVSFIRNLERRAYIALGIVLVMAVFISTLVAVLVSRSLVRPIKGMIGVGSALADMNFEVSIPISRQDEIGDMQRALFTIRERLQKTITDIRNEQMSQKNISQNLKTSIQDSSGSLEVIRQNMETVQDKADVQVESVKQTAESVEGIINHIRFLDEAVETQGYHINQSSESIERMVEDIESVRKVVGQVQEITSRLSGASETGQRMLKKLNEELGGIAEQSAFLEEANTALVNIAAQTNILAMNAAIEAAHAGEAGKGFAVVAGEVRNLAESSNKESTSISQEIKEMREGIGRIRLVSVETVETMGQMFREIMDMGNAFNRVTTAVEAQSSNGSRILTALTTLRDTAEQVRTGSGEIKRESGSIHDIVESLERISRDVNESVADVQAACRGIAESLERAQNISEGRFLSNNIVDC
jgi:methyl-accepting chemotaxis protein